MCSGKNMHHTRWWGNLWLLEAFPSWHRAQIMKHARTEYPSPSYWGAEKLDVSLIYIFLCGSPIGGALSASTRIKHMVFSSISAFWLLRRLLHTFFTFRKACLNAFILVVSCFITCSSQDHVISPRMSLIGVNPQTGIILRVRREKGLRLVF